VRSKVNPIIEKNPVIQETLIGMTDNIYQKQVGESFIFYQGTKGQSKGIMITSDINFHDELDRSDIGKVETYHSRLAHSQFKGEWIFSNPSRPNVGVDVTGSGPKKSSGMLDAPIAERGSLWTTGRIYARSGKFHLPQVWGIIDDESRLDGEWVAEYPGRDWAGYHISQLIAPWITAAEIIEQEQTKSQEYFTTLCWGCR